ncbi:MAG: putative phosphohydrolase [Acidobacteria bacterium]|nr:putative phosphohydrolase [Acidobacteriota bacterium]
MKTHFVLAGFFVAILLSNNVNAQNSGFPPLAPVPQTGQLQDQPAATHFWFIAAGDNRPDSARSKQPLVVTRIFKDGRRYKPSFFIWSGDTIVGFRTFGHKIDHAQLEAQYQEFFGIAALAEVPVFNSPGNHEMDSVQKTKKETIETPDAEMQALYLEAMKFPAGAPAYGAFNYGNSRFIAVDTEEVAQALTLRSPGKIVGKAGKTIKLDPGFVSQQQIALLTQDLEANKDKAHIFLFMHHPIKPAKKSSRLNKDNADELEALFQKYPNVSYVIAAHEHLYYNTGGKLVPAARQDPSSGGPTYIVSGGAGAPLDPCPVTGAANCGSFNHYLVFEVDGATVKMQVVKVSATAGKSKK